jgi:pimeloyl-ACP methyl ester carboxylesterase
MQLIAQQGRHETYDAVSVLGFSAIHTVVPTPEGMLAPHASDEQAGSLAEAWSGPFTEEMSNLRYAYHWENVDPGLVVEDMTVGFPERREGELPSWTTRTFPPFAKICLQEGVVAEDAAKIVVPVFVSAGERDVMTGIRPEATAYSAAIDITIYEIKECAHMHNFSPRREELWSRLQDWVDFVSK